MGINITTERVELNDDKKSYKNDGKIKVTVDIDNTVDNAEELSNVVLNLTIDDKQFEVLEGEEQVKYVSLGKEIKTLQYTLRAIEQNDLCAGTIYVSLAGVKTLSDGTQADFETAAQRSVILPSVGEVSAVQLNKINPKIVYTDGEKAVTISGEMKPLEAVLANDAAVELKLVHETTGHTVTVDKNNIAFLDESGETLTFTTEDTLYVGEYKIVFEINDTRLQDNLKCTSITCNQKLQVSADKKYQLKSYGMAALVRTTEGSTAAEYDFFTFRTEGEFLKFYKGESAAKGSLNGKSIKYNFGEEKESIKNHEILLTVRANLREMKDASTGELFWQADYASGDVIINNMLSYEGDTPLKIYRSQNTYRIEGDGLLKVINSINVWRSKWSISATDGIAYTLDTERLSDSLGQGVTIRTLNLSLDGAATMIQSVGGFAVDLKYGVLSSQWYDNSDGMVTYGTVTDPSEIKDGDWTVKYATKNIEISSFKMNGVDQIPEIASDGTSITLGTTDAESKTTNVTTGWKISGGNGSKTGTIDIYLTEDKDVLTKIKTSKNNGDVLGTNIFHKENAVLTSGAESQTVTLPDSLPDGKYYAVTTLSTTEGISLAISKTCIDFKNPNLPQKVDNVKIAYGGNGEIFVKVTDSENADYTHYLAETVANDNTVLENNIGQLEKGANFVFGKEASLETGKTYHVNVKTLREEYKESDNEYKTHYYYGTDVVSSNDLVMPEQSVPKLENVKVNFDTSGDEINTNVKDVVIEYTFDSDVFAELDLNGSKVYAFGTDPNPNSADFSYFKKDWKFVLDDLEDGDYVVDFTAYTKTKDHIKGSETGVENGQFGFTIDTSAPVLSLAKKSVDRKMGTEDITVIFGTNTIVADENGSYTIEGITEKSANITLDGEKIDETTSGVTIMQSGNFKIEKSLADGKLYKEHLITATDKAGNVSQMTVYAIRKDGFKFENMELYLDGNPIAADENGVKKVSLRNGQSAQLAVYAQADNGQKFEIEKDMIDWSVLYEKNTVELNYGTVFAVTPGETASQLPQRLMTDMLFRIC